MSIQPSAVLEITGINTLIEDGRSIQEPPIMLIWGRADYEDVFGHPHFIEWCYRIWPSRISDRERLSISFIQWPDYNRSDETQ
jgi:hypothetical protein